MTRQHNIIFDPIPFKGGSKIATSEALALCDPNKVHFTVVTVDKTFWLNSQLSQQHQIRVIPVKTVPWLSEQVHGVFFWLNQLYFTAVLLCYLSLSSKANRLIGASGPGVDMPIYLTQRIVNISVVQFIHGDVACSGSIGWCLTQAKQIFYLPSTQHTLLAALQRFYTRSSGVEVNQPQAESYFQNGPFTPFINGISSSHWPTRSQAATPHCFWAASLLKWKGLERFVDALRIAHQTEPVFSTICYIKPKQINLAISMAPVPIPFTKWHHDPDNFDQLRSQCNIFISTSTKEPFGLSILESLAAGMCVIIPQDGSYWDEALTDKVNCLKYPEGDNATLSRLILQLHHEPQLLSAIQSQAYIFSHQYRAEHTYNNIVHAVTAETNHTQPSSALDHAKKDV